MDGSISTLYVDVDPIDVLTRLDREDHRISVEIEPSVDDALIRLDDEIDCVVSAYELPERNGIELLETVRAEYPEIPFILITDDGSEAIASEAISAGVTDYVSSSVATERLADRIVRFTNDYRGQQFEQRTQQRPEQLLERVSDAFIALDSEWRFTYVNEAAKEIFGDPPEALLGERIWDAYPEAKRTQFYEHYHEAMADLVPRAFEAYYEPWDRWYREHLYPTEDGLVVLFRDITEQKDREREREHYRERMELALEKTDSILFEVNLDTDRVSRYGALNRILDISSERVDTWHSFAERAVHPTDRERFRRIFEEFEAGDRTEATIEYRTHPELEGTEWIRSELFVTDETDGDARQLVGLARDVTERKEYEQRLQAERKFVKSVFESLPDPLYAFDTDGYLLRWNEKLSSRTGYTDEEIGEMYVTDFVPDSEVEKIDHQFKDILVTQRSTTVESAFETKAGKRVPFEFTGAPLEDADGKLRGVTGVGRDITERLRREERLSGLNNVLVNVMDAEGKQAVCDSVIEAARKQLNLPVTTIALFGDDETELRPNARTPDAKRKLQENRLLGDEGVAWEALRSGERIVFDVEERPSAVNSPDDLFDCVGVCPLGRHGVFITTLRSDADINAELNFIETVAENLRSALDRVERETLLREHEAELEERNERLDRTNRINHIIRTIDRELVAATNRAEIERAVCRELADKGPYQLAWICRYDSRQRRVDVRAQAGAEKGYADSVSMTLDRDTSGQSPTLEAIRTEQTQMIENVRDEPPYEPWREAALKRGFQSMISLPLVYRDRLYGVLTLCTQHAELIAELERDVLGELSANIAHSINAIEIKRSLMNDTVVELDLRVPISAMSPLDSLSSEAEYRIDIDVISPTRQGDNRVIFDVLGLSPEKLTAAMERSAKIREAELIESNHEWCRFECVLGEESTLMWLLGHGVIPRSIAVAEHECRIVVHLPPDEHVREFVELFESRHESAELIAKRKLEDDEQTRQTFRSELDERLTPRQRETLQLAHSNGYFESPRDRTASEIATTLDISQPTFSAHLRAGQRKLFDLLYGDETNRLD